MTSYSSMTLLINSYAMTERERGADKQGFACMIKISFHLCYNIVAHKNAAYKSNVWVWWYSSTVKEG